MRRQPPRFVFLNRNNNNNPPNQPRRREREDDDDAFDLFEPPQQEMTYQQQIDYLIRRSNPPFGHYPQGNITAGNGRRTRAIRWMIVVRLNPDQRNYVLTNPIPRSHILPVPIAYVVGQYEVAPPIANPRFGPNGHIQMYLESEPGPARLDWVHLAYAFGWGLPDSEIQMGQVWMSPSFAPNREDAIMYVTKEETRDYDHEVFSWGQPANEGNINEARNEIMNAIDQGEEWPEIVARFGNQALRYANGYRQVINDRERMNEPAPFMKFVVCLYGATNKGKTTKVYEYAEQQGTKAFKKGKGDFWEGYNPKRHGVALFDEFRGSKSLDFDEFRKVVDDQAYPINVKNSFYWMRSKALFFNSNIDPLSWYCFSNEDEEGSFWRRFTGGVYEYMADGTIIPRKLPHPKFMNTQTLFSGNLEIGRPFVDMQAKFNIMRQEAGF